MNTIALKRVVTLEVRECPTCGVTYGMTETFIEERQENHETFYCPNGHSRYFPSKSREEILREENENLRQKNIEAIKQQNELLAELARTKKRANAGVCPQCHRHFANVTRHIESKHKKEIEKKRR